MLLGVALSLVSGVMVGAFALPMKRTRSWDWEHTWLAFSLLGLIVLPAAMALLTVPRVGAVWAETPAPVVALVMGFAALWGVASMCYGMAVKLVGIAIANAVILGLNNALGSILPIVVYTPGKLRTASGIGISAGVAVMIVGILLSAKAGALRDRAAGPGPAAERPQWRKGLALCFTAGVLGSSFTFALATGKPMEAIAVRHGASPTYAPNAIWPVALLAGCAVAIAYCGFLILRRRTAGRWFAAGTGVNWLIALGMAASWFGGVMIYGIASNMLGALGVSVGWAVLQSMTVITGAVLGFMTGEWRDAGRRPVRLVLAGVAVLVVGIVIVVAAGSLRG